MAARCSSLLVAGNGSCAAAGGAERPANGSKLRTSDKLVLAAAQHTRFEALQHTRPVAWRRCSLRPMHVLPAGRGVSKDVQSALNYYGMAFDLGHWKASYALGMLYAGNERE